MSTNGGKERFDGTEDFRLSPVQFAKIPEADGPLSVEEERGGKAADFPGPLGISVPVQEDRRA